MSIRTLLARVPRRGPLEEYEADAVCECPTSCTSGYDSLRGQWQIYLCCSWNNCTTPPSCETYWSGTNDCDQY